MIYSDCSNYKAKIEPVGVVYDRHKTLLLLDFEVEGDFPYVGRVDHQ